MSDETQAGAHTGGKTRGRKLMLGLLAVVGALLLFVWSFVLPILGIIHIVEMLS